MIDLSKARFGSAGIADYRIRKSAGLYSPYGAFIGMDEAGRTCRSDQQSAILLCGGARSGKGNLIIPWLVDGAIRDKNGPHHIITMDWKGQDSPVAALQVLYGRHSYYFNPRRVRGLASHRMNPLAHLRTDSPTLIADALLSSASWIPYTDPKAAYFEGMAQKINTAVLVTMTRKNGSVTLPEIADKIAGLGSASEEWLDLEYDISIQPEAAINEVAADLQNLRMGNSDSGGFAGIKNEIARSYTCMMDGQLRDALSPPFDFCFSWLTREDSHPAMVSIMENLEYAETSGPVIKTLYTCALIFKRRAITARPQFWCLNEIGNIGAWPLAETLSTISAGFDIRAAYVVQSTRQLENIKKGASEVVPNSCGTTIYMGTRSTQQAALISRQLGRVTLRYDDFAMQERARAAKSKAVTDLVLGHGDPITAMMSAEHHDRLAQHQSTMARDLRSVDEVINEKNDRAFVFMPGVLEKPFYARIPKYWTRKDLAGKYLGDPFHAKPGAVEISTWLGQRHRRVVTKPVPTKYADWPQYRENGLWSYVKGFRP